MRTKMALFVAVLLVGIVGTDSSFAVDLTESCNDYLVTTDKERVAGRDLSVTRFTSKPGANENSGVPLREAFADDPQLIIGIDTSNFNQPYMVVGNSLFRTTRSTSSQRTVWMFNAATKTSMPQTETYTTYYLGELEADVLPRGYFVRVSGLSKRQIERLRSGASAQVRVGSSNESWNHVIINLTEELAKHSDLELACRNPTCDHRYDLFARAIEDGFSIPGDDQIIATDFYTVDQDSLKKMVASARRSKYLGIAGEASLIGLLGVTVGVPLVTVYQALAITTGLPMFPMPFVR